MSTPAYDDEKTWSDHSRQWLRADNVQLSTAEIMTEPEAEECAYCGAIEDICVEDTCGECGQEGGMCSGHTFSYGLQTYFVSYT